MIVQRRQLADSRELPREHRGDRLGRELVDGRRARVPRSVTCEPAKFGYLRASIDPSGRSRELTGNSSITTTTTGVLVRPATFAAATLSVASGTVATNVTSPSSGKAKATDRNDRNTRDWRYATATSVAGTIGTAVPRRAGRRTAGRSAARRQAEAPDRDDVHHPSERSRDERHDRLRPHDDQRRHERDEQREHHHVQARRPTDDQELRVSLQHREDGLADAVPPQRGEVREPPPERRQEHARRPCRGRRGRRDRRAHLAATPSFVGLAERTSWRAVCTRPRPVDVPPSRARRTAPATSRTVYTSTEFSPSTRTHLRGRAR